MLLLSFFTNWCFLLFLYFPWPYPRPTPPPRHFCSDPHIPPTHHTHTCTHSLSKKIKLKTKTLSAVGVLFAQRFIPKKGERSRVFVKKPKNHQKLISRALQLAACLTSDAPMFSRVCARRDKPRCTREPACSSSNPGTCSSPAAPGTQPACCKPDRCRGSRRSRWHPRRCHRS